MNIIMINTLGLYIPIVVCGRAVLGAYIMKEIHVINIITIVLAMINYLLPT